LPATRRPSALRGPIRPGGILRGRGKALVLQIEDLLGLGEHDRDEAGESVRVEV